MIPLRYLSVIVGTALVLGVGWWRSGSLRATALLELPSAPEEQVAVRSLAELMIGGEDLLLQVITKADLSIAPEVLRERLSLESGLAGAENGLTLHLDFPGQAPFEEIAKALVEELDAAIRGALPEFRRERIDQYEERLRVLDQWLEGADADTQKLIRGQREVLEEERDQALKAWSTWNLRESLPTRAVRMLTGTLRISRKRADLTFFLQLFFALSLFFAILEMLGRGEDAGGTSRRRARSASQDGAAPLPEMPAMPPQVHLPEIRIPDFPPFPEIRLPETFHLELPDEVLERLRTPVSPGNSISTAAAAPPPAETGLPFRLLGDIPTFPGVTRDVPDSYRLPLSPRGGMPEPFPSLVAKLELLKPGLQVLQIAAWRSGLGASVTAVNLARSLARLGRRVILVDANLHRPALDQVYRVNPDEGLSDVLLDCEPLELLHQVDVPSLDLLVAGPCPPAPEELLASARFGAMIEELKEDHDWILLDGPPLNEGADALLMAASVDLVLPLVPVDVAVEELGRELQELQDLGVPILGVVSVSTGVGVP